MSSTQWRAQLQILGYTFWFALFQTDSGHVPVIYQMIQEPLRAGGVDGVRWLDDHRETPFFSARTWMDALDEESAAAVATWMELVRSEYGVLTWITGTGTHTMQVKVVEIAGPEGPRPQVRGGALGGFGATPGYNAYVDAVWTFQAVF